MTDKIVNLVKNRKEKTPLVLEKKEAVDNRTNEEVALQDYNFKVGDLFIGTHTNAWFEIYKIDEISGDRVLSVSYAGLRARFHAGAEILNLVISGNFNYSEIEWHHYGSFDCERLYKDLAREEYARIASIEDLKSYVNNFEDNIKDLSVFDTNDSSTQSSETALAVMDQNLLKSMEKVYEEKRNQIQLLQAVAKYKMGQLQEIKKKFITVVEKIHKVIGKIELYLGVNEDIVQIQDGPSADANTPISLFQRILYMDEEVGVIENKGIDWEHIDDFDNWLVDGHLDLIAPLQKCIVILKVRRKDKYYTSVKWQNNRLNEANRYTYILIRNGSKVYRIYADLIITPRLFPRKTEIEDATTKQSFPNKEIVDNYHNHFLVIQGILDRSDMLWPLPHKIDIFNEDTWNGLLQLIRDDEMLLPDGHVAYKIWKTSLNSFNKVGSRVVYSGVDYDDKHERMRGGKPHEGPSPGIYNLKRKESEDRFIFWYNPEDTVYNWGRLCYGNYSHKRKRSVGFVVQDDDYCIINYDNMRLDDIDFYINCRQEREHYLDLIPLLKQLKSEKLKELEEEKAFKDLIFQQLKLNQNNQIETLVNNVIEWWKMKVIEKRPLMREDAKALRMIKSKIRKELQK